MREIEFRGLATYQFYQKPPEKEWVYGSLQISYDELTRIIPLDPAGPWVGVDPETVGQYTGMKDKHGQKIYEGDVVEADCGDIDFMVGVVCYFDKIGAHMMWIDTEQGFLLGARENRVIGNVFDNPELKERFWTVWEENQK